MQERLQTEDFRKCVVFDSNNGTGERRVWRCEMHQPIGRMPTVSFPGYAFVGWYTRPDFGQGSRFTTEDVVEQNMVLYAHWNKESARHLHMEIQHNDMKSKWVNDERNQTSLLPGSDGYDDYIEDLADSSPLKEDDEMHVEMEKHNAELVERLEAKAAKDDSALDHMLTNRAAKMAQAPKVYADAMRAASRTPGQADDEAVRQMSDDNALIYDDSVKADDYADLYEDLTLGG